MRDLDWDHPRGKLLFSCGTVVDFNDKGSRRKAVPEDRLKPLRPEVEVSFSHLEVSFSHYPISRFVSGAPLSTLFLLKCSGV